jgi:hypothetical protein
VVDRVGIVGVPAAVRVEEQIAGLQRGFVDGATPAVGG